MIDRKADITLV